MLANLRPRTRRRSDEGYSLTELLISMTIFGVLLVITFSLLIHMTNMTKDTLARVRTLEEAKIGLSQIDRQVRSGNVILDPADEGVSTSGVPAFFSMRIYTQVDTQPRCAQWRVIDSDGDGYGNLEFRSWLPGTPSDVRPWSAVAHNLVKMDVSPATTSDIDSDDPSTWPPFWVDDGDDGGTQAQFVRVTLRLKDPQERADAKATSVTTVVTGRNTVFGYPASSCSTVPAP